MRRASTEYRAEAILEPRQAKPSFEHTDYRVERNYANIVSSFAWKDHTPITKGWLEIDKHYSLELCYSIEK